MSLQYPKVMTKSHLDVSIGFVYARIERFI